MMLYTRIRNLRQDKELTQKQMGEILSCSQRVYSNYECGDIDIPTDVLIKLSEIHNVSIDYLLCKPITRPSQNRVSFLQSSDFYELTLDNDLVLFGLLL